MFWPARPVPCEMACWMLYMHLFLPSFFTSFCLLLPTSLRWQPVDILRQASDEVRFFHVSAKKNCEKMAHFHFNLSKKLYLQYLFSCTSFRGSFADVTHFTVYTHILLIEIFFNMFIPKTELHYITFSGEMETLIETWNISGRFHEGSS